MSPASRQSLSLRDARRVALAAQGLGRRPQRPPTAGALLRTVQRLGVVQIDSVNVVSRTHYLPAFSRLGAYDRAHLETAAWGPRPALFEYWAHEASLLPLASQPLFRWRMADAAAGVGLWKGVARFLRERGAFVDEVLGQIADRGPLAAADLQLGAAGRGGWWGWSEAKRALEVLFWTGRVTTATRRGAFERVYGLPDQVLPAAVAGAPTPDRAYAQRTLLRTAAGALGVATERDLRDYFRMGPAETRARLAELVEDQALIPVRVEGWREPAFLDPAAAAPRPVHGHALLSPFDNAIWFRERAQRLFDVRIRLEIYTPAEKRTHGYYVLPFLEGEAITARVDLKADRKASVLRVQASHAEPWATPQTPARLAAELVLMPGWLGLDRVAVVPRGDLADRLAGAVGQA